MSTTANPGVLDMELRAKESGALAPAQPATINLSAMFERLVMNPEVPVDKLQALMDMQRALLTEQARVTFSAAMSDAQKEMRPIAADATNPQTRSRYASYEQLDKKLRPIYTRHGFSLSFDTTDSPHPEHVRVLCYVEHAEGHSRTYKVDMPADGKGAKGGDVMTKTHAAGAAMAYGMRYLVKMIFNVAVGEDDNDGNVSNSAAPHDYTEWLNDLTAVADEGLVPLQKLWARSAKDLKEHLTKTEPLTWTKLKAKAAKVPA